MTLPDSRKYDFGTRKKYFAICLYFKLGGVNEVSLSVTNKKAII